MWVQYVYMQTTICIYKCLYDMYTRTTICMYKCAYNICTHAKICIHKCAHHIYTYGSCDTGIPEVRMLVSKETYTRQKQAYLYGKRGLSELAYLRCA